MVARSGESDYEKPRILEIAEAMQNMESLDAGKKKQERAIKKGKEAELHSRKLEVSLNEIRRGNNSKCHCVSCVS